MLYLPAVVIAVFSVPIYTSYDGFKPKSVAYFTLYCELCMTAWKKKYIHTSIIFASI
jgi:hypothetical protein